MLPRGQLRKGNGHLDLTIEFLFTLRLFSVSAGDGGQVVDQLWKGDKIEAPGLSKFGSEKR